MKRKFSSKCSVVVREAERMIEGIKFDLEKKHKENSMIFKPNFTST